MTDQQYLVEIFIKGEPNLSTRTVNKFELIALVVELVQKYHPLGLDKIIIKEV